MNSASRTAFVEAEPQADWQLLGAHEEPVRAEFFDGAADEDRELREALEDLLLEGLLLNPAKIARAQRAAESCWEHAAQAGQEYAGTTAAGRENAARSACEMVLGWINEDMTPQAAAAYLGGHPAASAVQDDVPKWKVGLELVIEKVTRRAIAACSARAAAPEQGEAEELVEEPSARSHRR